MICTHARYAARAGVQYPVPCMNEAVWEARKAVGTVERVEHVCASCRKSLGRLGEIWSFRRIEEYWRE